MPTSGVSQTGIFDLVSNSGLVVQLVLLALLAASVFCWGIILSKWRALGKASQDDSEFLTVFWKSKSLDEIYSKSESFENSPVARVFKSGFKELQKLSTASPAPESYSSQVENINRALLRAASSSVSVLEKHLGWLATTASAAPFVGLFGTVWGIMNAFQKIGVTGAANLAVVAPGISEALIATAVGLAAAIPAVVAYNHFVNQIKRVAVDMECFAQDFLNIVQRGFLGGAKRNDAL